MFGCLGLLTLSYHLGSQVSKVTQLPSLTLILMDVTLLNPLLKVPHQLSGPFQGPGDHAVNGAPHLSPSGSPIGAVMLLAWTFDTF